MVREHLFPLSLRPLYTIPYQTSRASVEQLELLLPQSMAYNLEALVDFCAGRVAT